MSILVTICARGGSKGIPGKNIKPINGKPLIGYSIECALKFLETNSGILALSTDSDEILNVAQSFGLVTSYKRPDFLATDSAGKIDVIQDLVKFKEERSGITYDYILDLDITSPLRTVQDISDALTLLKDDANALNIFSVNPAARNPYFNMVEQKENGYFGLIKKGNFSSRQSAPKIYDMNASFYIYTRKFFSEGHKSAITDKSLIYEMPHLCFDLDEPHDFEFMAFLMASGKLDFINQ